MFGGNRIIDAEFEELEPEQEKSRRKKIKNGLGKFLIFPLV